MKLLFSVAIIALGPVTAAAQKVPPDIKKLFEEHNLRLHIADSFKLQDKTVFFNGPAIQYLPQDNMPNLMADTTKTIVMPNALNNYKPPVYGTIPNGGKKKGMGK